MGSLRFPTANFDETTAQFFGVLVMKDFTDLVYMKESAAIADSLGVAKRFNKQHKDIMRRVEAVVNSVEYQQRLAEGHKRNFVIMSRLVNIGNNAKRSESYYEMDRDGFTFLTMGFTGAKAAKWKWDYINAFNKMEEFIKVRSVDDIITDMISERMQKVDALYNPKIKEVAAEVNRLEHEKVSMLGFEQKSYRDRVTQCENQTNLVQQHFQTHKISYGPWIKHQAEIHLELFGMTSAQFRREIGIFDHTNILTRDFFPYIIQHILYLGELGLCEFFDEGGDNPFTLDDVLEVHRSFVNQRVMVYTRKNPGLNLSNVLVQHVRMVRDFIEGRLELSSISPYDTQRQWLEERIDVLNQLREEYRKSLAVVRKTPYNPI